MIMERPSSRCAQDVPSWACHTHSLPLHWREYKLNPGLSGTGTHCSGVVYLLDYLLFWVVSRLFWKLFVKYTPTGTDPPNPPPLPSITASTQNLFRVCKPSVSTLSLSLLGRKTGYTINWTQRTLCCESKLHKSNCKALAFEVRRSIKQHWSLGKTKQAEIQVTNLILTSIEFCTSGIWSLLPINVYMNENPYECIGLQ